VTRNAINNTIFDKLTVAITKLFSSRMLNHLWMEMYSTSYMSL